MLHQELERNVLYSFLALLELALSGVGELAKIRSLVESRTVRHVQSGPARRVRVIYWIPKRQELHTTSET